MRFVCVTGFVLLWVVAASAQDPVTLSIEQLKNGIENRHPSSLYILAEKLFAGGKKDEAVFWFYAGQLRYRVYLLVNQANWIQVAIQPYLHLCRRSWADPLTNTLSETSLSSSKPSMQSSPGTDPMLMR